MNIHIPSNAKPIFLCRPALSSETTIEIRLPGNSNTSFLNSDAPQNPLNSRLWEDEDLYGSPKEDYQNAIKWLEEAALRGTRLQTNNKDEDQPDSEDPWEKFLADREADNKACTVAAYQLGVFYVEMLNSNQSNDADQSNNSNQSNL